MSCLAAKVLSHFLGVNYGEIPMLFENAKSDKKPPKVKFAFFNSPEYKMYKIKRFFSVNTKRVVKISADTLVLRTHDNICFSPHMKKYIWHSS